MKSSTIELMGVGPDKMALERAGRLRAIRERIHKIPSQRAFAAVLGVSQARYNNWERGWPIPEDKVKQIKDLTPGLTGDWLLWGDQEGLTVEIARLLAQPRPGPPPRKHH